MFHMQCKPYGKIKPCISPCIMDNYINMHIISIKTHINVNTLALIYQHFITSKHNVSFHVQAMTHLKSSHVMVIFTYKLVTCQHINAPILTSKHVTTSSNIDTHKPVIQWPRNKPQTITNRATKPTPNKP